MILISNLRLPVVFLLCVICGACSATDEYVKRADKLAESGLYQEALVECQKAAQIDPDDQNIKNRMVAYQKRLAVENAAKAEQMLKNGSLAGAIKAYKQAIRYDSDSEEYKKQLKATAEKIAAMGERAIAQKQYRIALEMFGFLNNELPNWSLAKQKYNDVRLFRVNQLVEEAKKYSKEKKYGNALISLVQSRDLFEEQGKPSELELQVRKRLAALAPYVYRTKIGRLRKAKKNDVKKFVTQLKNADFGACPVVPAAKGLSPNASIAVGFDTLSFKVDKDQKQDEKKYKSGSKPVANPEYQALAEKLKQAQTRIKDLEKLIEQEDQEKEKLRKIFSDAGPGADVEKQKIQMNEIEQSSAEHKKELVEQDKLVKQLVDKQRTTPPQIDEPVYDLYRYPVSKVTRTIEAKINIELRDKAGKVKKNFEQRAATEDVTHKAYRKYGIEADPLRFPKSDQQLKDQVFEQLLTQAGGLLKERCQSRLSELQDKARKAMADKPQQAVEDIVLFLIASNEPLAEDLRKFIKDFRKFDKPEAIRIKSQEAQAKK